MTTEKKIDRILVELRSFREDVDKRFQQVDKRFEQVDKRFEQVDKRFEQVDKRFEQVDKRFELMDKKIGQLSIQTAENYKIAQRANVLVEDLKTRLEQVAEGTLDARVLEKKVFKHDERLTELEWRVDMHDKFIKRTA